MTIITIKWKSIEGGSCYSENGEKFRLPENFRTTEVPFTAVVEDRLITIGNTDEMIEVPTVVDILIG